MVDSFIFLCAVPEYMIRFHFGNVSYISIDLHTGLQSYPDIFII